MKKKLIGLGIFSIILVNILVNIDYQNGDIDLNLLNDKANAQEIEYTISTYCWQYVYEVIWRPECDNSNYHSGFYYADYDCWGTGSWTCTDGEETIYYSCDGTGVGTDNIVEKSCNG